MSVIRVLTDSGVKNVRINGDEPTPEEIELIKSNYAVDRTFDDQMGGMTAPSYPVPPQKPRQIPELRADTLTPSEREEAKRQAKAYAESIEAYERGDAVQSNVPGFMKARFQSQGPTQGEVAAGKGMGRALGSLSAVGASMLGDDTRAKQIDINLANIPYEPGAAGMAEGVTQFLSMYGPAKSLLREPIKKAIKGPAKSAFATEVAASGSTGLLGFSGQQERLADLIQSFPPLRNVVTEALETDIDDSFFEGRVKSMAEMAGLDGALALPFARTLKQVKKTSNADIDLSNRLKDFVEKNPYKATGAIALAYGVYESLPEKLADDFANTGTTGLGILSLAMAVPVVPNKKDFLKRVTSIISKPFKKTDSEVVDVTPGQLPEVEPPTSDFTQGIISEATEQSGGVIKKSSKPASRKIKKGEIDTTTLGNFEKTELYEMLKTNEPGGYIYEQVLAEIARRASVSPRFAKELEQLYLQGKATSSTKVRVQQGDIPDILASPEGREAVMQRAALPTERSGKVTFEGIQGKTNEELALMGYAGGADAQLAIRELQRRVQKNPKSKAGKLLQKYNLIPPDSFIMHSGQFPLKELTVKAVSKVFNSAARGTNFLMQKTRILSDEAIRPIKARVEDISKRMAHKLDEFEVNQNIMAGQYMHRAAPFLRSFQKMSKDDRSKFTRHALNSEMPEAYQVLDKYEKKKTGIRREFSDLIQVFDELHELGNKNGIEIAYREDYLPRILKDYDGFMKSKGVDPNGPIRQAIKQAEIEKVQRLADEAVKNNRPVSTNTSLTEFEEREVIRKFLEKKYKGDGTPGFVKERVIEKIDPEDLKFYGSFDENVQNYINNLTYRVAKNQFTGKVKGVEGYTDTLSKLIQRGKLSEDQGVQVSELINTRLAGGEQSLSKGLQVFRDGVYLTSIGNPISTITQTSEFFLNGFRYGMFDAIATVPKTIKRGGIRMSDIGIDDIAREFSDPLAQSQKGLSGKAAESINKILRNTLGIVQFKRMDELMKESNLNTAMRVARKKVADVKSKEYQEFAKEMAEYYGPETKKFLDALRKGDAEDPNVKTYLYSQLAKTQPIGLSEYPEIYLKYPFLRPAYFLKSFGLKMLETTRRDVLRKLGSGDPKQVKEGVKQGVRLSVLFGGGMTGTNLFKDYLLDRDDRPGMDIEMPKKEKIMEAATDSIATLFGLSRYHMRKFGEDPYYATIDLFMPPKLLDLFDITHGVATGDLNKVGRRIEKSIPIGGKIYSEHWGSAAKYKRNERIKKHRKLMRAIDDLGKLPTIPDIPDLD